MNKPFLLCGTLLSISMVLAPIYAQTTGDISLRVVAAETSHIPSVPPVVVWLQPVGKTLPFVPTRKYTLLQKNRTFVPHIQVVPVGSVVQFPNVDPFFHNVFSLFDGRRFDLGLYEAGTSKSVTFNREGVSYIFCNIHSEMSAVILSLATPLYTIAKLDQPIAIDGIPSGNYVLHFWVEGVPQPQLDSMNRPIKVSGTHSSLGDIPIAIPATHMGHTNKFGSTYTKEPGKQY